MTHSLPLSERTDSITIKRCTSHAEYCRCVQLQIAVWNFDPIDVVSHHILAVATETGGQVLAAYEGERMVGFAQAFAAGREGKMYLHSHMLAVLPEYQSRGIGRLLKLAQREEALARGIDRIEWTFDPLEVRNAYFNIARLGAIIRRYVPNFYGDSSSPLHANLPTDRLVAEWRLKSPRVLARIAGAKEESAHEVTISLPRNMSALRRSQPSTVAEIQSRMRHEFLKRFDEGYAVIGFAVTETEGNYLLGKFYED
jgi:predicted GNAT superfamily acetyltransferase